MQKNFKKTIQNIYPDQIKTYLRHTFLAHNLFLQGRKAFDKRVVGAALAHQSATAAAVMSAGEGSKVLETSQTAWNILIQHPSNLKEAV